MRQKEVMGQSIRTSKSARPGTIIYVPLDKSEFRSTVSSDKKKNKIMKIVVMLIVMILVMSCCVYAVSYTHLDVYKRQQIQSSVYGDYGTSGGSEDFGNIVLFRRILTERDQ